MRRLRRALIGKNTELRLKNHGLLLDVNWDDDAPHPNINAKASFVYSEADTDNRDESAFFLKDHDFDVKAAVTHYCQNTLCCDVSDIIWLPIYEDGDDYISYSTEPFYDSELSGLVGFVYVKKDSDPIKTVEQHYDYFKDRLNINADWRNNRVFHFHLITDGALDGDGGVVVSRGGIYSSNITDIKYLNTADESANEMIDIAIAAIDDNHSYERPDNQDKEGTQSLNTLIIELSVDQSKVPDGWDVSRYIISEIESRCRVKIAIGSHSFNKNRGELCVNFLLSGLPLLSQLEKQSKTSLVDEIKSGQNKLKTKDSALDDMLSAKSYDDYSSYMIFSLMKALFETADGVIMNIVHRKVMKTASTEQINHL